MSPSASPSSSWSARAAVSRRCGSTENPRLGQRVRGPFAGERRFASWSQGEHEAKQGRELLDAALRRQNLPPKFRLNQV
jgi:hypothetical protein